MGGIESARTVTSQRPGLAAAWSAMLLWGALPLYLLILDHVDVRELLAWRILMSIPGAFLVALAADGWRGGLAEMAAGLAPQRLPGLFFRALMLFANWSVYVWLVLADRVIEASLAYYITPLMSVAIGVAFFSERITPAQLGALLLAGLGVVVLGIGKGGAAPGAVLFVCVTWCVYAALRKRAGGPAAAGLFGETLVLAPLAGALLFWVGATGVLAMTRSGADAGLLLLAGPMTALPLMLFSFAAQRVSFTTLGLLQYIPPSIQLGIGLARGEALNAFSALGIVLIWVGLAVFSWDVWRRSRAR